MCKFDEAFTEKDSKIIIGDEVQRIDERGDVLFWTRFIVTSIYDDQVAGIDICGEIYVYDVGPNDPYWQKTGKHYDILNALHRLFIETE